MTEHSAKKLQLVEITVEITKSQLKSRDFEISYREIVCCQPLELDNSKYVQTSPMLLLYNNL